MQRLRLRTVLAFTALTAGGGVMTYVFAGPWVPKITAMLDDARTVVVDSTMLAGLNLQALTVEGRNQTAREDLLAALDVEQGAPILSIDVADARQAIEALPWVKTANVERRLPDSVHVVLEEYESYALWQRGERYTLVDNTGVEIVDVPGADQSLPLIVGPDAPLHAAAFFNLVNTINVDLAARIVAAVRVSGRRWNVHFDNYESGVAVLLPEDDVVLSWTRLADLERDYRILERDLAFIDLRMEGQVIVRINPRAGDGPRNDIAPTATSETKLPDADDQQEI